MREKGQVQPVRDQQDSGFSVQVLQFGFPLREGQLLTSQTQILSQSVPEQEGIGSEGPSTQIPHQGLQTWKSQVAVTRPLESLTNR